MAYQITRFYAQLPGHCMISGGPRRIIETGLTLKEAQEHCRDKETSSSTCTLPDEKEHTRINGPWFDGYEEVR